MLQNFRATALSVSELLRENKLEVKTYLEESSLS